MQERLRSGQQVDWASARWLRHFPRSYKSHLKQDIEEAAWKSPLLRWELTRWLHSQLNTEAVERFVELSCDYILKIGQRHGLVTMPSLRFNRVDKRKNLLPVHIRNQKYWKQKMPKANPIIRRLESADIPHLA